MKHVFETNSDWRWLKLMCWGAKEVEKLGVFDWITEPDCEPLVGSDSTRICSGTCCMVIQFLKANESNRYSSNNSLEISSDAQLLWSKISSKKNQTINLWFARKNHALQADGPFLLRCLLKTCVICLSGWCSSFLPGNRSLRLNAASVMID